MLECDALGFAETGTSEFFENGHHHPAHIEVQENMVVACGKWLRLALMILGLRCWVCFKIGR